MSPVAMWLPFAVADVRAAEEFYVRRVGLSVVDSWDRGGEHGRVLRVADGAFVELVSPGTPGPVPVSVAFEVADVDAAFDRMRPTGDELVAPPHRYPRGHHGFEVLGPGGATVMVWRERP